LEKLSPAAHMMDKRGLSRFATALAWLFINTPRRMAGEVRKNSFLNSPHRDYVSLCLLCPVPCLR
jgi:hypothetical protein